VSFGDHRCVAIAKSSASMLFNAHLVAIADSNDCRELSDQGVFCLDHCIEALHGECCDPGSDCFGHP
jgi:hypothetical protein